MKELQRIVETFAKARMDDEPTVLATVVRTSGSTYRRPGARMLFTENGRTTGSVSGGCLEHDVFRQAQRVFQSRQPRLVTYDSTSEDDAVWEFGLGCNGVVDILIEYLPAGGSVTQMDFLAACVTQRRDCVLATVFAVEGGVAARVGDRLQLRRDLPVHGNVADAELCDAILGDAWRVLENGKSRAQTYRTAKGRAEVYVESVRPPTPLVIFGGGHDAVPLARLAKELGWYVVVVDGRPGYATKGKFSAADKLIVARPDAIADRVPLDDRTVAVIMNHNYADDLAVLRSLLPAPLKYIGVLGPKRRTEKLLDDLRGEGATVPAERLACLYGPVGLDIGADTPEEIGFAIIAEIKAVLTGSRGGVLRDREGPLHPRSEPTCEIRLTGGDEGEIRCGIRSLEVA